MVLQITRQLQLQFLLRSAILLGFLIGVNQELFCQEVGAKDTIVLEGFIDGDKSLTADNVYVLHHNVKVGKDATLTIQGKTKVLFDANTTIVVEGGLQINGSPKSIVELTSLNSDEPGNGLLLKGKNGKDIQITFARFSRLNLPLKFDLGWFRENVKINNCVFKEIFTGEAAILINNPVNPTIGEDKRIDFQFTNNSFVNNWSSIFIENYEDNVLDLKFTNNLVTNNVVYGIDQGVPSNAPVFGIYDGIDSKYKADLSNNAVFGNYQINSSTDTIVREISFGIQGGGEVYSIPNNFYRSKDNHYISSTLDHFYQNSDLPLLQAEPFLTIPSAELMPHIYRVKIEERDVQDYGELPPINRRDASFEVFFNKPVTPFGETQLESILYDTLNNELLINPVSIYNPQWSPDNKTFSFTVSNASFLRNRLGYIVIRNFIDNQGFVVPDFTIGQKQAINNYRKQTNVNIRSGNIISDRESLTGTIYNYRRGDLLRDKESVEALKALADIGDISYLGPYQTLAKTWEVGLLLGATNYTGSLTHKFAERDHYNFAAGIMGQYNAHKWFSLRAMLFMGQISGEDLTDPLRGNKDRIANFRNFIFEGNLTFHWHLLKYGTARGEKFSPSIFAGIALYRNNPMSRIFLGLDERGDPRYLTYDGENYHTDGKTGDDVWVYAQQVGTEGQTAGGKDPEGEANSNSPHQELYASREAPSQFKKVQVSFPMGISFNWFIRDSWNIGAEFGYRLTSTRYLDDVGEYYFERGTYDANGTLIVDPVSGLPVGAYQSIIDANQGKIKGKAGGKKITLPDQFTDVNRTGDHQRTYSTAAVLANPSLVMLPKPHTGQATAEELANQVMENDNAFAFPDGRKASKNADNLDSYFFFGIKVTKILKRRKDRELKESDEITVDGFEEPGKTEKKQRRTPEEAEAETPLDKKEKKKKDTKTESPKNEP